MKLLLIDHPYHAKTKSSVFMVESLNKAFDVTVGYYDEDQARNKAHAFEELNATAFDVIVFFQVGAWKLLRRLRGRSIVFIPMFDGIDIDSEEIWDSLENIKIVSFCRRVHEKALEQGKDSLNLQFFPESSDGKIIKSSRSLFFWQRNDSITWWTVKQLIGNYRLEKVHFHTATDPGHSLERPSTVENAAYNIEYSAWFPDRSSYLEMVSRSTFYVSPRLREGIGMSFLEAMARGCVVIAADCPTMNEYIKDGETGLLFDPQKPTMLDFRRWKRISENSREAIAVGHAEWKRRETELLDFIGSSARSRDKENVKCLRPKRKYPLRRLNRFARKYLGWLKYLLPYGLLLALKGKRNVRKPSPG
jgi:hypothetical protein